MAHKPKGKTTASSTKLSDTIIAFLNAQNQDLHAKSIMQTSLLVTLPKLTQIQVHWELDAIGFTYEAPTLPLPPTEPSNEEGDDDEMNIHLFNNALASLLNWLGKDGLLCSKLTCFKPLKRLARDELCLQYYPQLSQ
ncbi:hypothetical protein P691DRAFT_766612 [Macrolepiota fuliginosa MF-IS2]|uniref:Uncharacterized protein n=1 Tax=Macrolepiota fuliginosa MF-IS2 TaxID=1400762 RepID=A0A9P5X0G5_9AGAR|nr:hypothetical protein P691DRAFT_766612 [Macrolepiota fuliginosa MF-IS2]